MKVMSKQCATCPFRHDSQYSWLASSLAVSALSETSRICHSTGRNNAIYKRTGKKPMLCRGARNLQLQFFASIGFIKEPTDKAWNDKCKELNL